MLFFLTMNQTTEENQKLLAKTDASIYRTARLQQVLAQIEAALSRKENQKVIQKSKKL